MDDTTETKTCKICLQVKLLDAFYKRSRGQFETRCKVCMSRKSMTAEQVQNLRKTDRAKQSRTTERQELMEQRRKRLLDSFKDAPCLDCKQRFPPECMDFDHVRGEKLSQVGAMRSWAIVKILKEVAKCEVVCANCHRIRTKRQSDERRLARLTQRNSVIRNHSPAQGTTDGHCLEGDTVVDDSEG